MRSAGKRTINQISCSPWQPAQGDVQVNPALTKLFPQVFFSFVQITFSQNVCRTQKPNASLDQLLPSFVDVFLNGFLRKCSRFPRNSLNQVDFNQNLRQIRSSGHSPPHLGTFSLGQVVEWRSHFLDRFTPLHPRCL